MPACPPHLITSLSIDGDGWIVAPGRQDVHGPPIVTRSCERLLKELKLEVSNDLFNQSSSSNTAVTDNGGGDGADGGAGAIPLEQLPHTSQMANVIVKVMADIKRLGAPSEADLKRREQAKGKDPPRGRGRRGRGQAAKMEEQRRLKIQLEKQKSELSDKASVPDNDGDVGMEDPDDDGFTEVGDNEESSVHDEADNGDIPVELRLPATLNTLRVLIALVRPMLDHPRQRDLTLKMKHGPSIKKNSKHAFYLFSKNVYSCPSNGSYNEVKREYKRLLNEMEDGLFEKLAKKNSEDEYELNPKDWIASNFNHELFTDGKRLAEECMGPNLNAAVASKCHNALMDRFETEHDQKQYMLQRSIDRLHEKLASAISRKFNGARLTVYGSCLSGLALEGSHDVDVSVFIPELDRLKRNFDDGSISAEEYEKKRRRIIYRVRDALEYCRSRSFADLFAVPWARVPVVKGLDVHAQNPYTKDGSLHFDLCFLNDIAVVNSSLLREYSRFDSRVRILMLSVKSFAKYNKIASAADGTLSSYTWLNMVIFYLQCIGLLPSLQCPKLMEEHDFQADPTGNYWHSVNGLETHYVSKDLVAKKGVWKPSLHTVETDTATLLYGFFNFYSNIFPRNTVAASIRLGDCSLQKTALHQTSKSWRICMEDAFETFDSHCPHDLGCHVKEDGQIRINDELKRASDELEELLQQQSASDEDISDFLCELLGPKGKELSETGAQPQNEPQKGKRSGRAPKHKQVNAVGKQHEHDRQQRTTMDSKDNENTAHRNRRSHKGGGRGGGRDGGRGGGRHGRGGARHGRGGGGRGRGGRGGNNIPAADALKKNGHGKNKHNSPQHGTQRFQSGRPEYSENVEEPNEKKQTKTSKSKKPKERGKQNDTGAKKDKNDRHPTT